MSTVPFRCPYCGATEIHPKGRKLPEMCGQCRYDREHSRTVTTAAPAGFVRPGPPAAPIPVFEIPVSPATSSAAARIRRVEQKSRQFGLVFWGIIAIGLGLAAWRCESVFRRWAANPQAGLIAAVVPDPDQIILTDYLRETLDDPNFEFVSADRVDGAVVRRAWQAEMSDVVRRWELFVKNNPKAEFMGVQADLLDGDMQKTRHAVDEMRKFDSQRFFRLRFRAKNKFGAKELRDMVFTLEGTEVISSISMNEPFPVWASFMPMLDPRIWFIQVEIGKGKADSRDHAFDAIFSQPERRWESRP